MSQFSLKFFHKFSVLDLLRDTPMGQKKSLREVFLKVFVQLKEKIFYLVLCKLLVIY